MPHQLSLIWVLNLLLMGTCKYCGKSAGFFSSVHPECEDKHNQGIKVLSSSISDYFDTTIPMNVLKTKIGELKTHNYISEEDIVECTQSYLQSLSTTIKRQNAANAYQHIKEFVNNIGIPYRTLNSTNILDEIGIKFVKYHLVSYFAANVPLIKIKTLTDRIIAEYQLSTWQVEQAHVDVLDKAANNYLKDGMITDTEQHMIDEYARCFSIPINQLSSKYKNTQIEKIEQASIIKNIQHGVAPSTPLAVPVLIAKNEVPLWIYNDVTFFQEKIEKEFVGRHGGFSFKVIKGVYYRTGQSKGKPIEHSYMDRVGIGQLIITNQNIIFYSQTKSVKIPLKKIIGLVPYTDGIEVQKDGTNSKRMVFQGFDCWFVMNLISQINI